MRDARLNTVGEGANDVLRAFIAMVGIKPVADEFLKVKDALSNPIKGFGKLLSFGGSQLKTRMTTPDVPVASKDLRGDAHRLGTRVREFGLAVQSMLIKHREAILFKQYVQERIADAASELYTSACTLARLDGLMVHGNGHPEHTARDIKVGRYYLEIADRRIRQNLAALSDNDDESTTKTADAVLVLK